MPDRFDLPRVVCWVSCGTPSAVAGKMALQKYGDRVVFAYCETGSEHEDNQRLLADLERWYEQPIIRLKSDKYNDTWAVWEDRRYLAGINGAPCTTELKVLPRVKFQHVDDIHVFGYAADSNDITRANRLREHYFELTIETPLIEAGVNKAGCHAIVQSAGIDLPVMYGLGFLTNNCLVCVKATSANYYALVRKVFPDVFWRLAKLSRQLGVRLCRIHGERRFIDEIPDDWPTNDPIAPACDFLCQIAEADLNKESA